MNKLATRVAGLVVAVAAFTGLGTSAMAGQGQFSMGLEGFYDQYKEPGANLDVKDNSPYGSITAGYTYTGDHQWFLAVDGRGSYGRDHYSSVSGTSSGASQYEAELRIRGGTYFEAWGGTLAPYIGLGERFFIDEGTNTVTNLGYGGYNRYIAQTYVPVGAAWTFHSGDWTIVPVAEYDQLLYGLVFSELKDYTGYNVDNNQHSGWGLRGELMFGHELWGNQWEIGPFVRYWNISDSDHYAVPDGSGGYWLEPHNTRLQTGLAVRMMF